MKTKEREIKTLDIIVPCYNEEDNVSAFYSAAQKVAESMPDFDVSYVFVDDGSRDGTLTEIRRLAGGQEEEPSEPGRQEKSSDRAGQGADEASGAEPRVRYISFSRNFGKEAAMYAGLKASAGSRGGRGADYAVIIDADLQHPPEMIPRMLEVIEETGCDSCAARRVTRKGEPRIRSLFARTFYKIMNRFCDIEIVDGAVDFRVMSRQMVKAVVSLPETQRFSKGIFSWVGFDTRWIEFENISRQSGESKWTMWGLTKYAIAGFLDFAEAPLKATGLIGGIITLGAGVYLVVEIIKVFVFGKDVPGYESLICLILLFGGLVVAILSVIGEYIGRMYLEMKQRPIYVEKESNIPEQEEDPK